MTRNGRQVMDHAEQPRRRHMLPAVLLVLFCIAPTLGFASLLSSFDLWHVPGFKSVFTLSMAAIGGWTITSAIVSAGRERIDWFPLIIVGLLTCLWIYVRISPYFD